MLMPTFRLLRICTPVNAAAGLSFKELTAPVWEESQTWSKYEQFSAENQLVREVEEWLPAAILARSTLSTAKKMVDWPSQTAKNTGIEQGSYQNNTWMHAFLSPAEMIIACTLHSF